MGGGPSCASYGTRISPEPVTAGGIGGGGGGGVKERNSYIVFNDLFLLHKESWRTYFSPPLPGTLFEVDGGWAKGGGGTAGSSGPTSDDQELEESLS